MRLLRCRPPKQSRSHHSIQGPPLGSHSSLRSPEVPIPGQNAAPPPAYDRPLPRRYFQPGTSRRPAASIPPPAEHPPTRNPTPDLSLWPPRIRNRPPPNSGHRRAPHPGPQRRSRGELTTPWSEQLPLLPALSPSPLPDGTSAQRYQLPSPHPATLLPHPAHPTLAHKRSTQSQGHAKSLNIHDARSAHSAGDSGTIGPSISFLRRADVLGAHHSPFQDYGCTGDLPFPLKREGKVS